MNGSLGWSGEKRKKGGQPRMLLCTFPWHAALYHCLTEWSEQGVIRKGLLCL